MFLNEDDKKKRKFNAQNKTYLNRRNLSKLNKTKTSRIAMTERSRGIFNIIDDYDPFAEPNASFERSIKTKMSQRFDEKYMHKLKCERIRNAPKSAYGMRKSVDVPLTNRATVNQIQSNSSPIKAPQSAK